MTAKFHLIPVCHHHISTSHTHGYHPICPGTSFNCSSWISSCLLKPAAQEYETPTAFYLKILSSQEFTCAFSVFLQREINLSVNKCPSIKPELVYFKIKVSCRTEHKNMRCFMWESERILYWNAHSLLLSESRGTLSGNFSWELCSSALR